MPAEYDRLLDALTINVTQVLPQPGDVRAARASGWCRSCGPRPAPRARSGRRAARRARSRTRWRCCSRSTSRGAGRRCAARLRIDATDLDPGALEVAAPRASIRRRRVEEVPPALLRAVLLGRSRRTALDPARRAAGASARRTTSRASRRPRPPYHLIVCRNVVIYFDRADPGAAVRDVRRRARARRPAAARQGGDAVRAGARALRARGAARAAVPPAMRERLVRRGRVGGGARATPCWSRWGSARAWRSCCTTPEPRSAAWRTCCCPSPKHGARPLESRRGSRRPRCRSLLARDGGRRRGARAHRGAAGRRGEHVRPARVRRPIAMGERNVVAARQVLAAAQRPGGRPKTSLERHGRSVYFFLDDGRVEVRTVAHGVAARSTARPRLACWWWTTAR